MQIKTIRLSGELIGIAYRIGEGNVSRGIRKAVEKYLENPTDPKRYKQPTMKVVTFKIETEKMNELFRHAVKRRTTVSVLIRHQLMLLNEEKDAKAKVVPITKLK
ncbi:MAG: hypothetical protein QXS43_11990 [Metallosphaera sp.]|uniref:hypothetical protein n=1 Tax=Metallosphaera sp. TaxID=2020860 RepID=UPI003181AC27